MAGNAFGFTPQESLNEMLQRGAGQSAASTGAAKSGVGAAQQGLAQALGIGNEIRGGLDRASGLVDSATRVVNGADADIDAMRALVPQAGAQTQDISRSADALSRLASMIGGYAPQIAAYAPTVAGYGAQVAGRVGTTDALGRKTVATADALAPFIDSLGGISGNLNNQGLAMVSDSRKATAQGLGLLDMDPTSSGIAAEWRRIFDSVNPDTMAARARADAQNQSDAAYAQQMRDLARRGVSLSSGAAQGLQGQYKRALAALATSAMQNGRKAGYDTQAGYLSAIGNLAKDLLGEGTQMFSAGTGAEKAAGDAQKDAADVQAAMGSLYKTGAEIFGIGDAALKDAGDLYVSAAGITGKAADVLGESAKAESSAASAREAALKGIGLQSDISKDAAGLKLAQADALNSSAKTIQSGESVRNSFLSNLNDANRNVVNSYANLASAYEAAARYYLNAAATEVSAVNGSGARTVGGGRIVSQSEEPSAETGAWVDLTHGKASHADGAKWVWDPNAPAAPAVE